MDVFFRINVFFMFSKSLIEWVLPCEWTSKTWESNNHRKSVSLGLAKGFLIEVPTVPGPSWDLKSKVSPDCFVPLSATKPYIKLGQQAPLRSSPSLTGYRPRHQGLVELDHKARGCLWFKHRSDGKRQEKNKFSESKGAAEGNTKCQRKTNTGW